MKNYENVKKRYINYKFNNASVMQADKWTELEILSLLDRLNFPMFGLGTYIYMDLVIYIIERLRNVDVLGGSSCLELITQLGDRNSELYVDFAKRELNIDEKLMHFEISRSIEMIDMTKMDSNLLASICEECSDELHYGELAFVLASMVLGLKRSKKNSYKIRSLEK